MAGYCKVGISNNVEERAKNLYGDWTIYKKIKIDNAIYYETKIKQRMREFAEHGFELFNCPATYLEKIVNEEISKEERIELPSDSITIKANIINIGKLIKSIRTKQKLTQAQLAGACGTGIRFIVDLEKGKQTCEIGKVLHVINMLGIKLFLQGNV